MAITDELREYVYGREGLGVSPLMCGTFAAIADRIDSECERQLAVLYHDMSDAEYIELPKDADGEPIRIGDMVEWIDGDGSHAMEVTYLQLTSDGWYVGVKNYGLCGASELLRHHKQPTVEGVLREMLSMAGCKIYEDGGCEMGLTDEQIAEYAAKLRLAGDVE